MAQTTMSGDASNAPEASTYSAYITEELCRYDEHLRDVRGLAASTRKQRLRIIGWLLEGKFKHREIVIARMRPDDIRQFLARRLAKEQSASYWYLTAVPELMALAGGKFERFADLAGGGDE